MRLTIFAGLVAFARATDFDDEDLNFLRLLSSNASGGNVSATTGTPATGGANATTGSPATTAGGGGGNATTAAATTAGGGGGNATTAAATTAGGGGGGNATTAAATTAGANTGANTGAATGANTGAATSAVTGAHGHATGAATGAQGGATGAATGAQGGGDATTPAQGGNNGGGNGGGDVDETMAPISSEDFCKASSYIEMGMSVPPTIAMRGTPNSIGILCPDEPDGSSAEKSVYLYGLQAQTDENKAKCTGAVSLTCGEKAFVDRWNTMSKMDMRKKSMLAFCCGYPSGFGGAFLDSPKNGGQLTVAKYTDNACTTLAAVDTDLTFRDQQIFDSATATRTFNLATCYDLGYATQGAGVMWTACNGTGDASASDPGHYIQEMHYKNDCGAIENVHILKQEGCAKDGDRRRRRLSNHTSSGGGGDVYSRQLCSGGADVANMDIVTDTSVEIQGITSDITPTQATSVITVTADKIVDEVNTAAGAGTTVKVSQTGTGLLEAGNARRRLSQRRLANHAKTTVVAVTKTTIPTAEAKSIKTKLDTAASSGNLAGTTLGSSVVTALKADTSLSAVAGNITAVATVTVNDPIIPVVQSGGGGGAGTTSGAISEYLSYGVGIFLAAVMVM